MALDLSGFTIPERKYEGLYKLADTLASGATAEAAKLKKTGDGYKTLAEITNINTDFGTPYDSKVVESIQTINQKGQKFLSENKGATTEDLRAFLFKDVSDLNNYVNVSKSANKFVDEMMQGVDGDFYDKAQLKKAVLQVGMYNDDGTLKEWNEIKFEPGTFDLAVSKYGIDIMKGDGLSKALASMPNESQDITEETRDKAGVTTKKTYRKTWKPWEQEELDDKGKFTGRYLPKFSWAQDEGVNLTHEGEKVKVVTDDVFDYFYNKSRAMRDWVDSQAKFHSNEFEVDGVKLDENSPQVELLKKAVLYDYLEQNRTGKSSLSTSSKARMPKSAGGGGGGAKQTKAEADEAFERDTLHEALNEITPKNGYYDVSNFIGSGGYKYKNKTFGKKGIEYNPSTEKFKITLVDPSGNETKEEQSYATVWGQLKASNPNTDMNFLKHFKTFKPKKAAATKSSSGKTVTTASGVVLKVPK